MIARKVFEILADYHQFCIWSHKNRLAPGTITDEDCIRRIVVGIEQITLMPERNMPVPVALEICGAEPAVSLADYDHIVEASIALPHGVVVVTDLSGMFLDETPIEPGQYRLRFCGAALDTLSEDGLEGDDRYVVTLWPAPEMPVSVLKQFTRC